MGKIRRKFEGQFRRQLVQQIADGALTLSQAAREYQISPTVIGRWKEQLVRGTLVEKPSTRERLLESENERLKRKIGELVMEVEQLKKLQVYAQRLRSASTSVITARNWSQSRKGSQ